MRESTTSEMQQDPIDPHKFHFQALHRLADQIDDFDIDPAFPLYPDQHRRIERRHPFLAEIVIVKFEPRASQLETFRFIRGHSLNLSRVGVAFVTNEEVVPGKYNALIHHPDVAAPDHVFRVTVLWSRKVSDDEWEQGGVMQLLSSSVVD